MVMAASDVKVKLTVDIDDLKKVGVLLDALEKIADYDRKDADVLWEQKIAREALRKWTEK
jgi:hypothetical protein